MANNREQTVNLLVSEALNRCKKKLGKSREDVAAEMSKTLGCRVTLSMLNEHTRSVSPGRECRFPLSWVAAFCEATGEDVWVIPLLSGSLIAGLQLSHAAATAHGSLYKAWSLLEKVIKRAGKSTLPPMSYEEWSELFGRNRG